MEKIKVLVSGCNSHMGQIVCDLIEKSDNMEVISGLEYAARELSRFPVFESILEMEEMHLENENTRPDVIIDVSSPKPICDLIDFAYKYSIPIVIATSFFSDKTKHSMLEKYYYHIPIAISSNLSYEISLYDNLFNELHSSFCNDDNKILVNYITKKKMSLAKKCIEAIQHIASNSCDIGLIEIDEL